MDELEQSLASMLYQTFERGRGDFRNWSSISGEQQARYVAIAREMIRFAEYNRRKRTIIEFDEKSREHLKRYEPLQGPPREWVVE